MDNLINVETIRKMRADGNSFYRALIHQYFEKLLLMDYMNPIFNVILLIIIFKFYIQIKKKSINIYE